MIDQYVKQLDSPDAERRKKAVIALGKSGDRAALAHLARVYKTDPNPEVRELALKAGRYLKRETEAQGLDIVDDEPMRIEREDEPLYMPPAERSVSQNDIDRAKDLVEQALDWHVRGQDEKAKELLAKALAINPNLRRDNYTSSIAATVTGLPGDEAMASLAAMKPQSKEKSKRGSNRPPSDPSEVGWGEALVDLLLYGLVWAGGLTAIVLLTADGILFLVNSMALAGADVSPELREAVVQLSQAKLSLILLSIGAGVIASVYFLIQSAAMHFVATSMLGGDGTLTLLIRKLTLPYIGILIMTVVALILFVIFLSASTGNARTARDFESALSAGSGFLGLFGLATTLWLSQIIGKVYEFGTGKGCATQIIANILLNVLSFCCSFMFSSTMLTALSNSIPVR